MIVRLFDIENGKVVPTEHCYTIAVLKEIMEKYPEQYLSMFAYLQYMTCPSKDHNPFFNVPAENKEELILTFLKADFSPEDEPLPEALKVCEKLYDTPTWRAYRGMQQLMDNFAEAAKTKIKYGKEGNDMFLLRLGEKYPTLRASFKAAFSDLEEELSNNTRGGAEKAYDQ